GLRLKDLATSFVLFPSAINLSTLRWRGVSLSNGVLLGVTRGSLGLRYELPRTAARTAFSNSMGCAVKGRTAFTPMRRALAMYSSLLFAVRSMLASRGKGFSNFSARSSPSYPRTPRYKNIRSGLLRVINLRALGPIRTLASTFMHRLVSKNDRIAALTNV